MNFKNNKKLLIPGSLMLAVSFQGSALAAPVDCTGIDSWQSNKVYTSPDKVTHAEKLYQAKWWTRGEDPTTTGQWGVWKTLGECGTANEAPTVTFTAPTENSQFDIGQAVTFEVNASDSDGTITSTEFYVNNVVVQSPWTADSQGNKQVKVIVTDDDGATGEAVVNIQVNDIVVEPPVVAIDSPTSPVSLAQGEVLNVSVSASVSDSANGNYVSKVELLVDNAVFAVVNGSNNPYSFSWPADKVGQFNLAAKAYNRKNDSVVSLILAVTVTGNVPPTVALTSPQAGSQYDEGAVISISADAADSDGSVGSVEFFVDGSSIGVDSSAPYTAQWTAAGDGAHTLTASATDNQGAQTTSAAVSVSVRGSNPTDHEACRPDGLVGDSLYCDIYDTQGREKMGNDHARRVIGYFTSWRTGHDGKPRYIAKDIPWDKITHINYAFAHVDGQNKISVGDVTDSKNAATSIEWPGVAGAEMDQSFNYKGHFNLLNKYKKQHPDVKTLISVGGWAETGGYFDKDGNRVASGGFYKMASSQASIDTFADSAVAFLRQYGFDGLDIDYEYATSNNGAGNPLDDWIAGPNRGNLWAGYENLMKTLRDKLDAASKQDGKHYMLTIAAPASGWLLRGQEFHQITKYLDYVNIMSYDLHGAWNNFVGPNSALFDNHNDPELKPVYDAAQYGGIGYLNTDWAFHYFRGSMPAGRINIGLPYYTRGWKDVEGGGVNGLWGISKLADQKQCPPGTGTDKEVNPYANQNTAPCGSGATGIDNIWHDKKADGSEEPAGFNPMWHIKNMLEGIEGSYIGAYGLDPVNDPDDRLGPYTYAFDEGTQTASIYSAQRKVYLSIEDEKVMQRKVDYVVDKGIGGVMFWELAGDFDWHADRGEYYFGDTLTSIAYNGFKAATPYGNKKAEIEMPVRNLDIQVTYSGFKLGDNNYPINPKMHFFNNSDIDIPGGSVVEFDVATTTPGTVADTSGLGMTVIKDGSNAAGNNAGGLEHTFHRVQFTIPSWKTVKKGETLDGDIKVQLPISSPSNFTIDIGGVKYGFTEEHGNGKSFCDLNPNDPKCVDTPPPTNKCVDKGIDPTTVPAYPDFPQKDWQGNPSHAAQGDMMKNDTAVFKAKWWTRSAPGGADWEFVCNL